MSKTLLIANRGEIVVRVARTARRLGYRTVAIFSEADRGAPHVRACDEAVFVGPAPAAESYLSIERILDAARTSGADAVHPGYGFLSENAAFAAACANAFLVFVGPPASAIAAMGDKASAKDAMAAAGVPVLPSFSGEQTAQAFVRAAGIGYPLMLKASAGGGGKGMRVVRSPGELPSLFETTALEAQRAFGSGRLLAERALEGARHVEIQVVADTHGGVIALGERDCSVQRRHQKVLEEAPSPAVDARLREAMEAAAIAAARAIGYVGAGTVEFLLASDGSFYFLEMNTRLQVEHAVTEAITGIDLVAWQLRIAAGERLEDLGPEYPRAEHAIEARLYAEDPAGGFLPQAGRVVEWRPPQGEDVRVDAALRSGTDITPYYDPMIAKIVASGPTRDEARRTLVRALEDVQCFGLPTNRTFLIAALEDQAFANGSATTDFLATEGARLTAPVEADDEALALAAVLLFRRARANPFGGWHSRPGTASPIVLRAGEKTIRSRVERLRDGTFAVTIGDTIFVLAVLEEHGTEVRYRVSRRPFADVRSGLRDFAQGDTEGDTGSECVANIVRESDRVLVYEKRREFVFDDVTFEPPAASESAERTATAPMPGVVVRVPVSVGERVERGQTLVVLEAMKMMHEIAAGTSGIVESVFVEPGRQVGLRAPLVEICAATP